MRSLSIIMVMWLFRHVYGENSSNSSDMPSWKSCGLSLYCDHNGYCQNYNSFQDFTIAACLQNQTLLMKLFPIGGEFRLTFLTASPMLILDDSLDLNSLRELAYQYHLAGSYLSELNIGNLKGIDVSLQLAKHYANFTFYSLYIYYSHLNIVDRLNNKIDGCQANQSDLTLATLLNPLTQQLQIYNSRFSARLCASLFRHVHLDELFLSDSYFRVTNDLNYTSLNATIKMLHIKTLKEPKIILDDQILNKEVYANLAQFTLYKVALFKIQPTSLFKYLTKLKSVTFNLMNWKSFLHGEGGTEWIKYFNYDLNTSWIDFDNPSISNQQELQFIRDKLLVLSLNIVQTISSFNLKYLPYQDYVLTDTDFCLFYEFPHKQLVLLKSGAHFDQNQTSCTQVFLLKYYSLFYQPNGLIDDDILYQMGDVDVTEFRAKLDECDLMQRTNNCIINQSQRKQYSDPYFVTYEISHTMKFIKTSITSILGPLLSTMGLVANLLVFLTIVHNKLKYKNKERAVAMNKSANNNQHVVVVMMDEPLYFYMFINSIINLAYCLLYLLDFTITCTPTPILTEQIDTFKQYTYNNCLIKDIVVSFIASTLKLVSNVTLIQMTMNRYILVGKDHLEFIVNASNLRPRRVLFISFLVSILLSIVIVYELTFFIQSKTYDHHQSTSECIKNLETDCSDVPSYLFNDNYYVSINFYISSLYNDLSYWFQAKLDLFPILLIFIVIHDVASYFLFCVISLLLDLMTMKKLREVLNDKMSSSLKKDEEQKKKANSEMKSLAMTIANGLFNFVFRLPDLFSSMFFIMLVNDGFFFSSLCFKFNACLDFYDFSNIFYLFTLSFNYVLYYIFNSIFSKSFDEMINSIKHHLLGINLSK